MILEMQIYEFTGTKQPFLKKIQGRVENLAFARSAFFIFVASKSVFLFLLK